MPQAPIKRLGAQLVGDRALRSWANRLAPVLDGINTIAREGSDFRLAFVEISLPVRNLQIRVYLEQPNRHADNGLLERKRKALEYLPRHRSAEDKLL